MSSEEHLSPRAVDTQFLVRRSMTKGYELFSLLTPPVYIAFILARKGRAHFSANRFLRAAWVGGAAGCATGGALEYVRCANSTETTIGSRHLRNAYDAASLRADDHSTIGSLLFAVLTPALLWKRANVVNLILGGAGIGSSIGLVTHHTRNLMGDTPPIVKVPELPVPS
ncbi:hypothetical protein PAXRUDRAFT_11183 [Paxillus rubicundulus Ve08.2h10]|uniref:Uncharacterized protein n=1 Tax=Paxillus rubicundulus Ve08.2h10 TaxID=930991 RepID=A0A0D0DRT3_9AGAM|nr:hypothetical protein PAXRUDRAFT_11183 [Paxillus rubicundulus Ve08.2h10]